MLSRSHLLIEKELRTIAKSKLLGIDVSLINDNLYEWSAQITGPVGTPWEGGIFRVYLKFDEHYNTHPPRICFHTIPYHPNIDMITGRPCIDYLDDCNMWAGNIQMASVLLQIQNMLSNPVLEQPINLEAAEMLNNSPYTYTKIVSECVEYSKLISAGQVKVEGKRQYSLQSVIPTQDPAASQQPPNIHKEKRTTKLSFDDYLSQWNGIATTKPTAQSINTYMETIKDDIFLKKIHFAMTEEEMVEEEYDKQLEYDTVYYGTVHQTKPPSREKGGRDSKMSRINQMRKIYLPKKPLPTPRSPTRHSDSEGEHENLVTWTKNLNTEDLDN